MTAHPFGPPSPPALSPYRHPSPALAPTPAPTLAPALTFALTAITLAASLATSAYVRAAPTAPAAPPSRAAAATPRLGSPLDAAVHELARRHRRPLFVAAAAAARAARVSITAGSLDGPLAESVRALDAYAAPRGLWLHDADGVLRLEPAVTAVDLRCDDTLDACATRLERVAAVTVVRAGPATLRPLQLRAQRGVPAVECMRRALAAAGLQVDVVDRTLYVSPGDLPDGAIRALGHGRFALTRGAVDYMLGRPGELMRATRIMPETRAGRTVGVRVLGVHPGDLLAALGIESDDVIVRVNGFDVVSPDRCLEAYASMRRTDHGRVELERRGRSIALTYVIDPA